VNNTILSGIIVGSVALTAAGAVMVNSGFNPLQKYATVVAVQPAFDSIRTPRPVCGDEATLEQARAAAAATAAATDAGNVAQLDPATARPAATAESAAAGAPVKAGDGDVAHCIVVYDTSPVDAGFDVTYQLDGVQKIVRMDSHPGKRIPIKDGEPALTAS
jgi:uncharacterized protein YcfJ